MTVVRFGSRRVNAELQLIDNITDDEAVSVLRGKDSEQRLGQRHIFCNRRTVGASNALQQYLREVGGSGLLWNAQNLL